MGRARTAAAKVGGPRWLVLQKSHAQWKASQDQTLKIRPEVLVGDEDGPPKLNPGEEQLFSLYAPSLVAGPHHIQVLQRVTPPADSTSHPLDLQSSQDFEVIAPRFSLPAGDIHTVYPPQGHGDDLKVLPHIVFNDEHLPWERSATIHNEPSPERNRVPWLALMVFTQDELRLAAADLAGPAKIFPSDMTQSTTLSLNVTIADLQSMETKGKIAAPIADPSDPIDPATASSKADFIFIPNLLFKSLVQKYNTDGSLDATQTEPDVQRYKFLSHVRNINTEGMGGDFDEEVDQLFSVVVAHRTGPWTITRPTAVVVHLVSIEGIEGSFKWGSAAPYVALCSLYSWTYQCLPPAPINFVDAMTDIGSSFQSLRLASDIYTPMLSSTDKPTQRVGQRLQDGFTLSRYKVRTGEETVAFVRGPFVPTKPTRTLNFQSTFSTDLQILDRSTGIMDISYSLAWQLGKTMAISDQAFTAAVSRLRGTIHDQAVQMGKSAALTNLLSPIGDMLSNLPASIRLLATLHERDEGLDPLRKWQRQTPHVPADLSFFGPAIRDNFQDNAKAVAKTLASSLDHPPNEYRYYNEHNRPYSTDWAQMMKWLIDRMYLVGIPAHYFITDPSHLPNESLRFFAIDPNWIDAFIDGALSICVHLEQDDDQIRVAMKSTFFDYLDTVDPDIGYKPQIPTYGVLLRSGVVKQFPNLVVKAPRNTSPNIETKKAPILRQENIDEQVLLVLLDREPGDGLITYLSISQPPHQQCFAAAANVGPDMSTPPLIQFEVAYVQVYTTTDQPPAPLRQEEPAKRTKYTLEENPICPVFDWNSRMLIFPNYATNVLTTLQNAPMLAGKFTDKTVSAALMGIHLNEPMYQMTFQLSKATANNAGIKAKKLTQQDCGVKGDPSHPESEVVPSFKMLNTLDRCESTIRARHLQAFRATKVAAKAAAREKERAVQQRSQKPTYSHANPPPARKPLPPAHTRRFASPAPSPKHNPHFFITKIGTVSGPPPPTPNPVCALSLIARGHNKSKVPSNTGYSIDLLFTVNVTGDTKSLSALGFKLQSLNIYLPILPSKAPGPPPVNTLLASARTGNARMLSNLRWNPLMSPGNDPQNPSVVLQLIPRTTSGGEDLYLRDTEMGFIVNQVEIAGYETDSSIDLYAEEIWVAQGYKFEVPNTALKGIAIGPVASG